METQYISRENPKTKYEPHVLEDIVDPVKNQHSYTWISVFVGVMALELFVLILFIGTLNRNILFQILWFNAVSPFALLALILLPTFWLWVAGSQKRLDDNLDKMAFNRRIKNGYEKISKHGDETSEEAVRSVTGMINFDPNTGLAEHIINESKWSLEDHPYQGKHSFGVIAFPKFTEDEEVIIENFHEISDALLDGCLKRITSYTGLTLNNILDDVEKQLTDPNISKIRGQALLSIYNHYAGRAGNFEPMYIITFGLPFTVHKDKAVEFMRRIRDEYETPLNSKGVDTVLVTDPEVMKLIIHGMLAGKMYLTGDINEY